MRLGACAVQCGAAGKGRSVGDQALPVHLIGPVWHIVRDVRPYLEAGSIHHTTNTCETPPPAPSPDLVVASALAREQPFERIAVVDERELRRVADQVGASAARVAVLCLVSGQRLQPRRHNLAIRIRDVPATTRGVHPPTQRARVGVRELVGCAHVRVGCVSGSVGAYGEKRASARMIQLVWWRKTIVPRWYLAYVTTAHQGLG